MILVAWTVVACTTGAPAPKPGLPPPGGTGWKQYPSVLNGNPTFTFPTIEGKTNNGTDTWYIQGELTGVNTGRKYSFITIFAKNRIDQSIRSDVYTLAIFPLDSTDYGTFTDQDTGLDSPLNPSKLTAATGYLDLGWRGAATWKTSVDAENRLIPFNYDLDLHGGDAHGQPMALVAHMDVQDPPAAPGPGPTPGIIRVNGQLRTGNYFFTGLHIDGDLTYGGVTEPVHGTVGHMDRQWFPQYAGAYMGQYARDHGHDWGSIHLDDDTTLDIWNQINRPSGNTREDFTGMTRSFPSTGTTEFAPDLVVTPTAYVRFPSSIPTSFAPPAPNRYLVSSHDIDVPSWNLHLVGTPITAAPFHALPVEYESGPVSYAGTLDGQPIEGFGEAEHTAAMYKKFELVDDVLATTVAYRPDSAFLPGGATRIEMQDMVRQLKTAVDNHDGATEQSVLNVQLVPAVASMAAGEQPFLSQLLQDIADAPYS